MTVPDCYSPNDVSPQWLSTMLATAGFDTRVEGFSMQPIGTGQIGQNIRFTLQYAPGYDDGAPLTLVCKFASDDPVSRATGIAVNDYLKEVLFYQQLASTLDVTLPQIYFSAIELAQPDNFVLVMQDLSPAVQGDQLAGCDSDRAALALSELAGIAGPRWCDPALKTIDWLAPSANTDAAALWNSLMPGFIERYQAQLAPEHLNLIQELGHNFSRYHQRELEHFTVAHIDYRLDNMMFGGPNAITIVDWAPGIGSGAGDAAYFMSTGMDSPQRGACERALLTDYHLRLKNYGIDNYSFDDCWRDYRSRSFGGLIMAVIASMIVEQTERGDAMFMTMTRRSAAMAIELEALSLLA